jgi:exopolyphosphatase / guanosine-5'-triphosphate,3'-diphosphate pyrophosphatase
VFDIGGGSTEVVHGRGDAILFARSFDVGSVRLTERHVRSDPPAASEIAALREDARRAFEVPPFESAHPPIGIAGTMTTLAAVSLEMEPYDGARVHGLTMTVRELEEVVSRLERTPLAERSRVRGLEPKRADVIVAGGHIALAYLERIGAREVLISDRGVRWGLAEKLAR